MEIILFLLTALFTILFSLKKLNNIKVLRYITLTAFTCFLLHWLKEGIRWQLYLIYLWVLLTSAASILSYFTYFSLSKISSGRIFRSLTTMFLIIILLFSAAASYAFPLYNLMKPNGEYKVGTISFDAENLARKSLYRSENPGNRRIRVQLWYPSDDVSEHPITPWLLDGPLVAESMAKIVGVPDFLFSPIALIKSNSHAGAPISTKKSAYPIVIISHGLTSIKSLHTDLAEMFASNGYIVASINHTNAAAVTVFESGEIEYLDRNILPYGVSQEEFLRYGNSVLNTYAEDIRFTIDTLAQLNSDKNSILGGKLDLSSIGLLGHSAGGGAGVLTALTDTRIKAIVGFDPWLEPIETDNIATGLKIPALFLRSEQWETDPNNKNLFPLLQSSKGYRELYQINGTTHLDFTMIYMYSPLSKLYGYSGELAGRKGSIIRQDFVLTFFNKYLIHNTNSENIESLAHKYDEVEIVDYH